MERICDFSRDMLRGDQDTIHPYRAGYLADYRRETERKVQDGRIVGLVTTNAMELGVDVGGLDATVIAGYPGTVSSVWQQAGRSGRAQDPALSLLIARDHPVDQFFMQHPEEFFGAPYESARISTTNPRVMEQHLRCAAHELPLSQGDFGLFGEEAMMQTAKSLVRSGALVVNEDQTRRLPSGEDSPAFGISIRSMNSGMWHIANGATGEVLERVDDRMAYFDLYPGAVYMHKAQEYEVVPAGPRGADGRGAAPGAMRLLHDARGRAGDQNSRYDRDPRGGGHDRIAWRRRGVGASFAVLPQADLQRQGVQGGPAGPAAPRLRVGCRLVRRPHGEGHHARRPPLGRGSPPWSTRG